MLLFTLLLTPLQAAGCPDQPARRVAEIHATVAAGKLLERPFGGRFLFRLRPQEYGWRIEIGEAGRDENLARLTPPWHFAPNPADLEGWHFRNRDNTGPNDGSVNAPQDVREVFFSPEVGRTLEYSGSATPPEVVDSVAAYGSAVVRITGMELTPAERGGRAGFTRISIQVCIAWRRER